MFEKKDKKLELVKEMLGTRNAYIEVVKDIDLTEDERTLLMRASSQIKKENPNLAVIAKAYAILTDKVIEENAPAVKENLKKSSKIAMDDLEKITDKTIILKKYTILRIVIWIFLIVIVYQGYHFLTDGSRKISVDNSHKVPTSELKISCDDENVVTTVKKLSLSVAESKLINLIMTDYRNMDHYQKAAESFHNIDSVILTSVYPTSINKEIKMITCSGDVDIYSKGGSIPMAINYKVQFDKNGLNGYVEITSANFRNNHFMYLY